MDISYLFENPMVHLGKNGWRIFDYFPHSAPLKLWLSHTLYWIHFLHATLVNDISTFSCIRILEGQNKEFMTPFRTSYGSFLKMENFFNHLLSSQRHLSNGNLRIAFLCVIFFHNISMTLCLDRSRYQ